MQTWSSRRRATPTRVATITITITATLTLALFSNSSFQLASSVQAFAPNYQNYQPYSSAFRISSILQSTVEETVTDATASAHSSSEKRRTRSHSNKIGKSKHVTAQTYKDIKEVKRLRRNYTAVGPPSSSSPSQRAKEPEIDPVKSNASKEQKHEVHEMFDSHDEHDIKKRIHNIHNIRSTRTSEERKRSSERLGKAQILLDDFVADIDRKEEEESTRNTNGVPDNKSSSRTRSTGDSNKASTSTTTVPDNLWYNGNLQEGNGDFVTRWARGVKVAEPLRKYDPVAAEKLLFRQPTKWIVRNTQIGLPLALWAIGVASDVVMKKEEENRRNRAKQLLQIISGLGPAIIKGGQALASRSDLMPSEYLEELQKLQDDVPRFDNGLALATVDEELGVEFDSIFELVYREPIAAASIGQVYKARLKSNGDLVALKIQRPKCEEVISLDLYVLRWWSGVANILTKLLNKDIDVQSIIDDFGELIYRELDYVAEAANAQRFSELYAGQVEDIFVPKVYSELTTSKVLTMEWVDGFRLTDSDSLNEYGLDRKKLVDTLVQCSLRQILGNGFFHADPHAGNLLVVPDGRLCYLDFGMMSYAGKEQRNGFLLAVVHIVNRDWDELVLMYQRLGFIPEGTDLKPIAVALENSLPDALNAEISELNFKNVVGKLGDIMYTYPFSLPPFYIAIIRCLGVLEGLAIQVDPQARIISEAYPYVASRVLTDPQDELQEALRRLALTNDGHIRWSRLESLLSEAKGTQGYDASVAVNQLTSYLISEDGESLLFDLADQVVDGADSLGTETVGYIIEASRALIINDEVAAAKAFTTLQEIFNAAITGGEEGAEKVRTTLSGVLPEPSPSMQQFWRISVLLGARGSSSDPSKLIPIVRKLSQEPKIQRVASEIAARLGERVLSRSLRALFGLPLTTN